MHSRSFPKHCLFIGAYSPAALPGRCLPLCIFKISSVAGKQAWNVVAVDLSLRPSQPWELVVAITAIPFPLHFRELLWKIGTFFFLDEDLCFLLPWEHIWKLHIDHWHIFKTYTPLLLRGCHYIVWEKKMIFSHSGAQATLKSFYFLSCSKHFPILSLLTAFSLKFGHGFCQMPSFPQVQGWCHTRRITQGWGHRSWASREVFACFCSEVQLSLQVPETGDYKGNSGRDGPGQVAFSHSPQENMWEGGRVFGTWQGTDKMSDNWLDKKPDLLTAEELIPPPRQDGHGRNQAGAMEWVRNSSKEPILVTQAAMLSSFLTPSFSAGEEG